MQDVVRTQGIIISYDILNKISIQLLYSTNWGSTEILEIWMLEKSELLLIFFYLRSSYAVVVKWVYDFKEVAV